MNWINKLDEIPRELIYRVFVVSLSLVFFSYFPHLVFTSYMSWEGFFSYDMFAEGASGIKAFYWWTEIIFIIASVYLAGSVFVLTKWKLTKKIDSSEIFLLIVFIILNLIMNVLVFVLRNQKWEREGFEIAYLLGTVIVAVWVNFHVAMSFYASAKKALISLCVGVFGLITISILMPGSIALPYSMALQAFGNGGGLEAEILLDGSAIQTGRAVFISPEYVYLSVIGTDKLLIIQRKNILNMKIKNLSGFGHR